MHALTCLVPLLSLAWDGGKAPLDKKVADQLRSSLSSRELQVALLSPAEQKKYDAALLAARQPQKPARGDVDKLQSARQFFKEAAIRLQFKQETKALDAERNGLHALLDRWDAKRKWPVSDLSVLQTHFEPFDKLGLQDPQLLLTVLHDLDEQYTLVRAKLQQRGTPPIALAPIADAWARLSKTDTLTNEDWDIAASWGPLLSPQSFSNRKLSDQERTQYLLERNGVAINYKNAPASALLPPNSGPALMQAAQVDYERRQLLSSASSGRTASTNIRIEDAVAQWEGIDLANIRFMESLIDLQHGQDQQALLAFNEGLARVAEGVKRFSAQASLTVRIGNRTIDQFARMEPLISSSLRNQLKAATPRDPCWRQPQQQYQEPVRQSLGDPGIAAASQ